MIVIRKVEEGSLGSLGKRMHHALRDLLFFLIGRDCSIRLGHRGHLCFDDRSADGRFILLVFNSLACLSIRLHSALLFSFVDCVGVHLYFQKLGCLYDD